MLSSTILNAIYANYLFLVVPLAHFYINAYSPWRVLAPPIFHLVYIFFALLWKMAINTIFDLSLQEKFAHSFKEAWHREFRKKKKQITDTLQLIQVMSFVFLIIYCLLVTYAVLINDLCFLILWSFVIHDSLKLYKNFNKTLKNDLQEYIPDHQRRRD